MPGNSEPQEPIDFEEATRVRQVNDSTWEGINPLRLPLRGARGVYGGHICAQTLLVAMKSAPGYVPHSFHSHFVKAGSPELKCTYKVSFLNNGESFCQRHILSIQNGHVIYTAMCSLVRKDASVTTKNLRNEYMHTQPNSNVMYKDPTLLHKTYHTDFIVNAYSDEFIDYGLCPEERDVPPSERWISLWSKLHQPKKHKMDDTDSNYVGLVHLSDSAVLTTLARALHMEWNPTIDNPREEFDEDKDARHLMNLSLNALHLHHYTAMSLDHHVYFHSNDTSSVDVLNDWLLLTYQYKVSKNYETWSTEKYGKTVRKDLTKSFDLWRSTTNTAILVEKETIVVWQSVNWAVTSEANPRQLGAHGKIYHVIYH